MNVRRLVGFLLAALLIYYVITQPAAAAESVRSIADILKNAADSVASFFTRLVV